MELETQELLGFQQMGPIIIDPEQSSEPSNDTHKGQRYQELQQRYGSVEVDAQKVISVTKVSPPKKYPRRKKTYFWVLALFLLYAISFGLAIPALPGLVLFLTDHDSSLSSFYFGLATSLRYCLEFISAPVLGTVADIRGRKFVLQFSFFVCVFELGLLSFVPSIPMLFVARAISGMGDMGAATTYTMVTDIATFNGDNVTQKYSLVGAMLGLAFIIGPLVGGVLCAISIRLCLLTSSVMALVGFILSFCCIEETLHFTDMIDMDINQHTRNNYTSINTSNATVVNGDDSVHRGGIQEPVSTTTTSASTPTVSTATVCGQCMLLQDALVSAFQSIRLHFSNSHLRKLTVPYMLCTLAGGYIFTWYIFMNYQFHSSPWDIGLFLSFHGVISAVVQGIIIPRLVPSVFSEQDAALYGLLLSAIHVFCFCFCTREWNLYLLAVVFGPGSMYFPAMKALIVQEGLRREGAQFVQGNLQGVMNSMSTGTMALGALLFSALFSAGLRLFPSHPISYLPFVFSSCMYLLAFLFLGFVFSEGSGTSACYSFLSRSYICCYRRICCWRCCGSVTTDTHDYEAPFEHIDSSSSNSSSKSNNGSNNNNSKVIGFDSLLNMFKRALPSTAGIDEHKAKRFRYNEVSSNSCDDVAATIDETGAVELATKRYNYDNTVLISDSSNADSHSFSEEGTRVIPYRFSPNS